MTEQSNVIPIGIIPPKHLPALAVQLNEEGRVTTVINTSRLTGDDDAYDTTITPVFDGRFFCTMQDGAGNKLLWIVERFGIIRPGSAIERAMWFGKNPTMAPDPTADELSTVSQTLLVAARDGASDPKLLVSLLGYAAELCDRMAARSTGQRLPIYVEKPAEEEAV